MLMMLMLMYPKISTSFVMTVIVVVAVVCNNDDDDDDEHDCSMALRLWPLLLSSSPSRVWFGHCEMSTMTQTDKKDRQTY
jgi:hypothetical protein